MVWDARTADRRRYGNGTSAFPHSSFCILNSYFSSKAWIGSGGEGAHGEVAGGRDAQDGFDGNVTAEGGGARYVEFRRGRDRANANIAGLAEGHRAIHFTKEIVTEGGAIIGIDEQAVRGVGSGRG